MPLLLADRWAEMCGNSIFTRRQENESPTSLYSSTLGLTNRTKGPPFEPLQSWSLRVLSLKTTLLLALASVKRVGDLQALSITPACLEFRPNNSKVILKPRLGYVSKVLSTPFRAQVIALSAHPPKTPPMGSQESLLCPVRALKLYIEPRTESYNNFFLASVTALKVALLWSREFLGG